MASWNAGCIYGVFLFLSLPAGRLLFIFHARDTVNSTLRRRSIVGLIRDWIARYSVLHTQTQALARARSPGFCNTLFSESQTKTKKKWPSRRASGI